MLNDGVCQASSAYPMKQIRKPAADTIADSQPLFVGTGGPSPLNYPRLGRRFAWETKANQKICTSVFNSKNMQEFSLNPLDNTGIPLASVHCGWFQYLVRVSYILLPRE